MLTNLYLLWIFVIIWQPTFCFYNLCQTPKNNILNNEECLDLYFEENEKATSLGEVKLELDQNSLKITPEASSWTDTFLKITVHENETNFCSKLSKDENPNFYCFTFSPEMENETFLIEYRVEDLPEISFRRFLFFLPDYKQVPLFLYVDQTDNAQLILRGQKLTTFNNMTYKVEAYKEKNGNTNLLDLKLFSNQDEIFYELFTYKDMGYYYFVVSVMNDDCTDVCLKMSTPKIFIGRKSTRVVIGIVGASFILPFILFIFHILTKKYQPEEETKNEERLVVAYKSSSKKHNEVVLSLAAFLEKMCLDHVIEIIDLSKPSKKSEKFCTDSLLLANRIVYVAPPKNDLNPIFIDKSLSEKEFLGVIFDYSVDKLPEFFAINKTFKLFDDFEKFIQALNISETYDATLYQDLVKKSEDAKIETDHSLNADTLPQIIVTESEPQENDSLISSKVVL